MVSFGTQIFFCTVNILFNFQGALEKTKKLEDGITEIHNLTKQLALYFCEDEGKLKLQELLSLFKTFCDQLVKAKKVNKHIDCCFSAKSGSLYLTAICDWVI